MGTWFEVLTVSVGALSVGSLSVGAMGCGDGAHNGDAGDLPDAVLVQTDDARVDTGATPSDAGATCADERAPSALTRLVTGAAGPSLSLVLDDHGDPAIAYLEGMNVRFQRWDRCAAAWTTPAPVDTVTADDASATARNVSLAFDATTGAFGIAYLKHQVVSGATGASSTIVRSTTSDGGHTWSVPTMVSEHDPAMPPDEANASAPMAVYAGGELVVAYVQRPNEHVVVARGASHTPISAEGLVVRDGTPDLAVDDAGHVGVAFWALEGDYNSVAFFARPGSAAVRVTDTNDVQNDRQALSLAFVGEEPLLALTVDRETGGDIDPQLYVVRGSTSGTFSAPTRVTNDGTDRPGFWPALAARGSHQALAIDSREGSPSGACGGPKLYRSSDGQSFACTDVVGSQLGGEFLDVAIDAQSQAHFVFHTGASGSEGIYYVRVAL